MATGRRAAQEGNLELGSSLLREGQSQCQTRSPCSWAVLPFTCLLPTPGHLSSRRCRQRDVCAEAPVSPPGTSPALREPHCFSDRQVPRVSVPSLPPLSLPYSALPSEVLAPLSHLRRPPQAPRALEARALSVTHCYPQHLLGTERHSGHTDLIN